jgi:hypothetical protein
MKKRRLVHPNQPDVSFVEANRGRLVTMEHDVLDIRRTIEETWPELRVFFDEVEEKWVVVENCGDGRQRLATKADVLDHRLLRLLQDIDSHKPGHDREKRLESWNDRIERQRDQELEEHLAEFAERFKHALRKDGFFNHEHISNCVGRRVNRRRIINA